MDEKPLPKSRSRPSLELYKPPVLRGRISVPQITSPTLFDQQVGSGGGGGGSCQEERQNGQKFSQSQCHVRHPKNEYKVANVTSPTTKLAQQQQQGQKNAKKEKRLSLLSSKKEKELKVEQEFEPNQQQKEKTKPPHSPPDFHDLVAELLSILGDGGGAGGTKVGEFLARRCSPHRELARQAGIFLVKHLAEDCGGRNKQFKRGVLSKTFAALSGTPIAGCFYEGAVLALERYFEFRDRLRGNWKEIDGEKEEENEAEENEKRFLGGGGKVERRDGGDCGESEEHFNVWLNSIGLAYELGQIAREERVLQLVFNIFYYLLNEPVLSSLKIAELESTLSILLIIGQRLELDYPDQVDELRVLLRNASLHASESWARKMLLLMVELGAAGWRVVPQLEDYYYS